MTRHGVSRWPRKVIPALALGLSLAATAGEAAPGKGQGPLTEGTTLAIGPTTVKIAGVELTAKLRGATVKPRPGKTFLAIQIAVVAGPGRVSTVDFVVTLKSGERLVKPGFVTEIVLFGRRQKATGKDGATAQLKAGDKATLWFEVKEGTAIAGATLEHGSSRPSK
jgi:hypothetical protein